ncbi:hypothetical protein [Photobacterium leiognathi]|uniref:hypothetical protein n=1 Tax=Photobacterium leiognathi TaxID=553611 RepID=UPI002981CF6D|nr:hypothetical protein [Photobacterium leiognathi]
MPHSTDQLYIVVYHFEDDEPNSAIVLCKSEDEAEKLVSQRLAAKLNDYPELDDFYIDSINEFESCVLSMKQNDQFAAYFKNLSNLLSN